MVTLCVGYCSVSRSCISCCGGMSGSGTSLFGMGGLLGSVEIADDDGGMTCGCGCACSSS